MIAKITFEDKKEEVVINLVDAMADKPTPAQEAAMQLFVKIKAYIKSETEPKECVKAI